MAVGITRSAAPVAKVDCHAVHFEAFGVQLGAVRF